MRPLLTAVAVTTVTVATAAFGMVWLSDPAGASAGPVLAHQAARLGLLGCEVPAPDLKDLSKLPEVDCR